MQFKKFDILKSVLKLSKVGAFGNKSYGNAYISELDLNAPHIDQINGNNETTNNIITRLHRAALFNSTGILITSYLPFH